MRYVIATSGADTPGEGGEEASHRQHAVGCPTSTAAGLVIQTYWAAVGRAWTLGAQAARTLDPDEQRVLLELVASEEARLELARRLLAEVWGIQL